MSEDGLAMQIQVTLKAMFHHGRDHMTYSSRTKEMHVHTFTNYIRGSIVYLYMGYVKAGRSPIEFRCHLITLSASGLKARGKPRLMVHSRNFL
jgi:hypothetical protein